MLSELTSRFVNTGWEVSDWLDSPVTTLLLSLGFSLKLSLGLCSLLFTGCSFTKVLDGCCGFGTFVVDSSVSAGGSLSFSRESLILESFSLAVVCNFILSLK